ncbi:MAG TPA: hypothetical protein VJU59_32160 [Paraburkholderia sp.]|jgi:photosystem II stability/assembly factor-like uncharacterized protein|uniref:sialidase family protein n=1 Tax=Paraburkholderia sp. TaxID=1926495 RepID=UPI002B478A3E|nr:hypothetical protein [Paraburkholderia sp.]HKR44274.1 hypothetical protein [Paraburkholderia sp.]
MRKVMLVGTATTRPEAIGTLFKLEPGGEWQQVSDIPADASVQAITPHPSRENVVYVAARKGVYRSTDGGDTWQQLNVTDENVQFWTVVVHPQKPDVLFAGTGPVGVYRSDDGGDTWRKCNAHHPERFEIRFGNSRVMRIAFHPTNAQIMYAVAEINGFLVSEDGGENWRGVADGLVALADKPHLKSKIETDDDTEGMFDAHSVCTTTASPDSLFYVCRLGVFESQDLGKTFRDLEVGKFAPFQYARECRFVHGQPKKMYACFSISSRSAAGALYVSEDLGATWARADAQVEPRSTMMGFGTHVSDADGVITVTRGGQVFFTTDGSKTWTEKQLPANAGDAFCGAML